MSQSIETGGFDELDEYFEDIVQNFPQKKAAFMAEAGEILRQSVTGNIASAVNDSSGHVQGWQKLYFGTGGGYAAVRAIGTADGGESGKNGPGAITNYLEGGHKPRPASGKAKRIRRGRAKLAYVDGRHFYDSAKNTAEPKLIASAENFMDSVVGKD